MTVRVLKAENLRYLRMAVRLQFYFNLVCFCGLRGILFFLLVLNVCFVFNEPRLKWRIYL